MNAEEIEERWLRSTAQVTKECLWMCLMLTACAYDISQQLQEAWQQPGDDRRGLYFTGYATAVHFMRMTVNVRQLRRPFAGYLWWRKSALYLNRLMMVVVRVAASRGSFKRASCSMMKLMFRSQTINALAASLATPLPMRQQLRYQLMCTAICLASLLAPRSNFCSILERVAQNEPDCAVLSFIRHYQQVLEVVAMLFFGGRIIDPPEQFVPYCREALMALYVSCNLVLPMAWSYYQLLMVRRASLLDRGLPAPPELAIFGFPVGWSGILEAAIGVFLVQAILLQAFGLLQLVGQHLLADVASFMA